MTRYTVVWLKAAKNQLAEIWLASVDRDAVTRATSQIDKTLGQDAPEKGTDFGNSLRALYVPPLAILFCVRADDRLAEVAMVRSS